MSGPHLWIRHETRPNERRAPLTPADARTLLGAGFGVCVEVSSTRVFTDDEYAAAGCELVPAGSWVSDAARDTYVLGIRDLPDMPERLERRHIFFGHVYKGQRGAADLLRRFRDGGGELLDIGYLTTADGRRLAGFGYWAGYAGAALGVLRVRGALPAEPLRAMERVELDEMLRATRPRTGVTTGATSRGGERYLVTGALGRGGRGAREAIELAGGSVTGWDVEDTREFSKDLLLSHEVLVNCVAAQSEQTPFVTASEIVLPGRLMKLIVDVACDVTSDRNMIPVNRLATSWAEPVRRLSAPGETPLDVIAIDDLSALLPRESSAGFSHELVPALLTLADPEPSANPWAVAREAFREACDRELGPVS